MSIKHLLTSLYLMFCPICAFAEEAEPVFFDNLPARAGAWEKAQAYARYDARTIYDYIDGAAELYLAFGFSGALAIEYADGDDVIKIDIFDMGGPEGAFGAFARGRETVSAEVGQGSEYSQGLLIFWKHRWFVSVLGYPETEEKRGAVMELGRAVADLIPRTGPLPSIFAALPQKDLMEASVRTFRHHLLQNDHIFVSHDNPLEIGPETQAIQARYTRQKEGHVLMMVDYPSGEDAGRAMGSFKEAVLGGGATGKMDGRWAAIKRNGKRLIIILDAPSRREAAKFLGEVS